MRRGYRWRGWDRVDLPTLVVQSDIMDKGRAGGEGEEGWWMISMKPTPAGLYFFIGS